MQILLGVLFIFFARICDVSVGTMRVMYTIRGNRWLAALLGLIEAGIWIIAVRQIFSKLDNYWNIAAYAAGFATGTFIGITLERWIASGWILARIISLNAGDAIRDALHEQSFGVTTVPGEGRDGNRTLLFVVAPRRRSDALIKVVHDIDPQTFITIDPVSRTIGGHLPHFPASGVRK